MFNDGVVPDPSLAQTATSVGSLPPWALELALEVARPALVEAAVENVTENVFVAQQEDPAFLRQLTASATENTDKFWSYLTEQIDLDDIELIEPLKFARIQARLGISQTILHSAFRRSYTRTWRWWIDRIEQRARQVDAAPAEVAEAIRVSTERMLLYWNLALDVIAGAYAESEREARHTGEQARLYTIRTLLRGDSTDSSETLFMILGYDVSLNHLAIRFYSDEVDKLTTFVREVRAAAKASGALIGRLGLSEVVVWVGRPRSWPASALSGVRDICERFGGAVDLSRPEVGLDGLRHTHAQLKEVGVVRGLWGPDVPDLLAFEDCQFDALALRDLDGTRAFVRQELGELAADSPAAAKLRETLAASFLLGSHVATAEHLGLHEHTVRNRLRRARELLGERSARRALEIQIALRLYKFVGSSEAGE